MTSTGQEVHVTVAVEDITAFMAPHHKTRVCFRCGEEGHLRAQCLTYKVRLCWYPTRAECPDVRCTFAHGIADLRTPWKTRCVRVVKQGGELVCIGCQSSEHTFRKCPLHKDMLFLT